MIALPGLIDSLLDCWAVSSLLGLVRSGGNGDVTLNAYLVLRESVDDGGSIGWVMTASSEETLLVLLLLLVFGCLSIEYPRLEENLLGWVDVGTRSFINRFLFSQYIFKQSPSIGKKEWYHCLWL